ncbi:MAG: peptidoglycan DD-metalloendopeptidase family protein [Chloroflexi bacterium]|nr:peptidoglycan DD-metalloendopeptidase family protein [Chloroflexota bacterium]
MANETHLPPASRASEATNSKWIPSTAESFRPEPETTDAVYTVQASQQFHALPYSRNRFTRLSRPISGETHSADTRFGAGIMAVDALRGSDATAFSELRRRAQAFLGDQISPIRLASHLAVIAVAAVVLIVSQIELPDWQFSLRNLPKDGLFAVSQNQAATSAHNSLAAGNNASEAAEAFQRAVIPFTNQQTQPLLSSTQGVVAPVQAPASGLVTAREQIETYSVRSGDTVLGIAAQFNLQPETIQWANPELEANPDMLRIGDRLVILPVDGVLHVVQRGDTLSTIAAKYKVTTEAIVGFGLNHMADSSTPIAVGQQLVIPGGNKPYIAKQVLAYSGPVPEGASRGSGNFAWPTSGTITQPYWNGHRAIDVGAWTGTAITAADSGYVIATSAGWNNGYGTMVMIDHGGGYVTLYGHMNSIFVRQGESVAKGQQIGTVGNTGNSTGPHLHFEVRYQGVARNPFNFLP